MSTTSPQAEAAGEQAAWQAQLAKLLSETTLPELQKLMGGGQRWVPGPGGSLTGSHYESTGPGLLPGLLQGMDSSGRLGPDAALLASVKGQLNQGYDQAGFGSREAISYGALRSGEGRRSPGAVSSAMQGAATSLERDRMAALRNLEFQSAQTSLTDYNRVLQLLGQGVQTSLGLAQGFSGATNAAIGGMSQNTQAGSILGGATAGAGLGASIPGAGIYGAVIGGAVGAGAGALGYGL